MINNKSIILDENCSQSDIESQLYGLPKRYKLLVDETMIDSIVEKCANEIIKYFISPNQERQEIVLLGILNGASFFLNDLSRKISFLIRRNNLSIDMTIKYLVASAYHGKLQASDLIVSSELNTDKLIDKQVILIDELVNNGETLSQIIKYLEQKGLKNIYSCTAFIKKKKRLIEPSWFGLEIPDVWLVGYGIDDFGKYRELPILCFVEKPEEFEKTEDDNQLSIKNYWGYLRSFYLDHFKF